MPITKSPSELRALTDSALLNRWRDISERLAKERFARSLGQVRPGNLSKELKKECARILTIQRERQLSLSGILERTELSESMTKVRGHSKGASVSSGNPVVSAKLLGSEYPIVVGRAYTMILQRDPQSVSTIERDLFGNRQRSKDTKKRKHRTPSNFDLDLSFQSLTVQIRSDESKHQMKRKSSLSIEIVPQQAGRSLLDIVVSISSSKRLLQVLQVPLSVIGHKEFIS